MGRAGAAEMNEQKDEKANGQQFPVNSSSFSWRKAGENDKGFRHRTHRELRLKPFSFSDPTSA